MHIGGARGKAGSVFVLLNFVLGVPAAVWAAPVARPVAAAAVGAAKASRKPKGPAPLVKPAVAAGPVRLSPQDGCFHYQDGSLFVPLGGFHGNVMPISMLNLTDAQRKKFEPYLWNGCLDLLDAPEPVLKQWYKHLSENGITAIRLFPRARAGLDLLDLCGKLNPELQAAFHRAFAAAQPYGIRFMLQIMGEPERTCYMNADALATYVIPRYTPEEIARLLPAQQRFLSDRKCVTLDQYFTDSDVLACQQLYVQELVKWLATEPQVFALEIYNEQGWANVQVDGKWEHVFTFPYEEQERQWTIAIARMIRRGRGLPYMPVCISLPGFGVTGLDPLKWSTPGGSSYYRFLSPHLYAGLCGSNENADFPLVTAATSAIIGASTPSLTGEWGILNSHAPADLLRRNQRDAIWLSLMARAPGFMQWDYTFLEEYREVARIFSALPKEFRPTPPVLAVDISPQYQAFQTNTRYPLFAAGKLFPAFPFNQQKQQDPNLKQILAAYRRSLDLGQPIRFVLSGSGMPLDKFMAFEPNDTTYRYRRPVRAVGGYQLAYLWDYSSRVCVGYLRSRKVEKVDGHYLAVPAEAPLTLQFAFLPGQQYVCRLINLNTGAVTRQTFTCTPITAKSGAPTSMVVSDKTSEDYAVVITPATMKLPID